MMRRSASLVLLLLLSVTLTIAQQKPGTRVLFIPLDDRPPCLQFTQKMGKIANAEVIAPPLELLGKFTKAGEPDKIIDWIRKQDLNSFDAVIVSVDMLAYGGLVASRILKTDQPEALRRINILGEISRRASKLPVYAQAVMMRLAPTSDGKNEAYREKLARWAAVSPYPENSAETMKLEQEIPPEALMNYKLARHRNLAVNMEAVRLARTGVIDYLILSQDDAKPNGVHIADREKLAAEVSKHKLNNKILIQPGADEISMLLLARVLNGKYKFSPKVFVKYSSQEAANTAMPFEDRPLQKTISYDIAAAGATETKDAATANLLFYVFTSRFDPGRAASFAAEIMKSLDEGKKVMVADVDPKGNVQGGDTTFTRELLRLRLLPELYSYASWNTAGNTVGTALPQGLIFDLAKTRLITAKNPGAAMSTAQHWFTFHRVLDDYYFHSLVRPQANAFFNQNSRSGFESPEVVARQVEKYSAALLLSSFNELAGNYSSPRKDTRLRFPVCTARTMNFTLPWNRTFEAEIDFKMSCD